MFKLNTQIINLIFLIFCSLFVIDVGFSYINVSSCSPSWIDGEEYRVNQTIVAVGTCLNPSVSNIAIDCQGNTIIGPNIGWNWGIYIQGGKTNITIRNCVISNFSPNLYLRSNSNQLEIYNMTLVNSSGSGLYLSTGVSHSLIYDIDIYNNVGSGISIANNNFNKHFIILIFIIILGVEFMKLLLL